MSLLDLPEDGRALAPPRKRQDRPGLGSSIQAQRPSERAFRGTDRPGRTSPPRDCLVAGGQKFARPVFARNAHPLAQSADDQTTCGPRRSLTRCRLGRGGRTSAGQRAKPKYTRHAGMPAALPTVNKCGHVALTSFLTIVYRPRGTPLKIISVVPLMSLDWGRRRLRLTGSGRRHLARKHPHVELLSADATRRPMAPLALEGH
jgi:hypothetical protein